MNIRRLLWLPAAMASAWLGLATAQAAVCAVSLYSAVGEKDCKALPFLEAGRNIVSRQGEYVFECPGAPPGYQLYFVDSDHASWYVVEYGGKRHSFEKPTVYDDPPGNFPHVGEGGKVEWLLSGGKVTGLIFRVGYQDKAGTGNFSRLLAIDLGAETPALRGMAASHEEARQLLGHCQGQ